MPVIVTVNRSAECLRTDCNILGGNKKKFGKILLYRSSLHATEGQTQPIWRSDFFFSPKNALNPDYSFTSVCSDKISK